MGVEPTGARCSRPPTDFEDRGAHRDTSTPTGLLLPRQGCVDTASRAVFATPCPQSIPQFLPAVKQVTQLLPINVGASHLQHRHLLSSAQDVLSLNLDN